MVATAQRAAIYARISSDQDGTRLGVERQLKDCRKLAGELGWEVVDEYVDNDISAYSGKHRPDYERLLADIESGMVDALVCYHADRLTRRPIELERFVEVAARAGLVGVRFVSGGEFDVTNGDGLLMLRLLAAVAANESASKSRRVSRRLLENAEAGRPHGGSHRPFGFDDDRITHRPDEAAVIRTLAARFIAGESWRSLAAWLDDQGVRTVAGGPWRTPTLKQMLTGGRIAGLRTHQGEIIGEAVWEPIISVEDHHRILARVQERTLNKKRTVRSYLLTGLGRCGKCGNTLFSASRQEGKERRVRRYVCQSGPDHRGCGKLTVVAEPLEELVTAAVLYRLDGPELADLLAGRAAADEHTAALAEALAADRELLDELSGMVGRRELSVRELGKAREPIEARIRDTQRKLQRATRSDHLDGLVGNGDQLRSQWNQLNLTRQNAIVAAVVDHIVIGPGVSGARSLDSDRVDIVWRA